MNLSSRKSHFFVLFQIIAKPWTEITRTRDADVLEEAYGNKDFPLVQWVNFLSFNALEKTLHFQRSKYKVIVPIPSVGWTSGLKKIRTGVVEKIVMMMWESIHLLSTTVSGSWVLYAERLSRYDKLSLRGLFKVTICNNTTADHMGAAYFTGGGG